MKNLILSVFAFAVFHAGMLQAQDISGTWQGTLRAGARELRIVIKISKDASGLKALMYSIDQGPGGNPSNAVTVQDSNMKIPGFVHRNSGATGIKAGINEGANGSNGHRSRGKTF